MFCPRCGQQQATDSMRFCARCGFPMEGAMHLLANGGMLPHYQPITGEKEISRRRKGVKQGALLLLLGAVLVPALGVVYDFTSINMFYFFTCLAAVCFFIGGPLRMLYAGLFEEGARTNAYVPTVSYTPPMMAAPNPPVRMAALPPAAANSTVSWRQRPQTAEIVQPPSVTDGTTRLLERSEPEPK